MMKQGLQIIGAVSLVAWTMVGVFAWTKVEDHLTVVISDGGSEQVDANALLADRIDSFSGDLDALVAALDANFALLASALEDGRAEDAVELARVRGRLAELEAALPAALHARETAGALDSTLLRLEALAAIDSSGRIAVRGTEDPVATSLATQSTEGATIETPPAVEPETASAPTKRGFLAFDLPSRDFHFEGKQSFEVLGDLSRVGFDAKSTLHDFSGVSNNVSGSFDVDLSRPQDGISGRITVRSESLTTDLEGRDEAMWEHIGKDEFPTFEFVPTSFVAARSDVQAMQLDGHITGRMTIHGVTQDVAMDVKAHVDESRRLVLEGEMPLLLSDYEVVIPGKLGMISTDDEVRIWIALRTRAQAAGARD